MLEVLTLFILKYNLIFLFLFIGILTLTSELISKYLTSNKIHGSVIILISGLVLSTTP